ncbi:MAG: hypothetical protein QOJ60_2872 [Actinomycetota bacterium]|nr:hypothetical protein [Actinomycetota bacterium]
MLETCRGRLKIIIGSVILRRLRTVTSLLCLKIGQEW